MGKRTVAVLGILTLATGPAAAEDDQPTWRAVFATSAVATAGLLGFGVYAHTRTQSEADQIMATGSVEATLTNEDCARSDLAIDDQGGHFRSACAWHSRQRTAMYFGLGLAVVTLASAYFAFSTDSGVSITPAVSPDGAAAFASVRF